MKDLKIGDIVRVIGKAIDGGKTHDQRGKVVRFTDLPGGFPVVETQNGTHPVYQEQCRRIKKKTLKTYWIGQVKHQADKTLWMPYVAHTDRPKEEKDCLGQDWIIVKELPKKKRPT